MYRVFVLARLEALFLTVVLLLLVIASTSANAAAATASVEDGGFYGTHTLRYVAGAGEANEVEVSREGQIPTIHDSGAVIVAEAGCLSVDAHTVTCTAITGGILSLGDLADSLTLVHTFDAFSIAGGAGPDTLLSCVPCQVGLFGEGGEDSLSGQFLAGGPGNDTLSGTSGTDVLDGGRGNDTIRAGEGSDSITPGGGNDVIDAGAGTDGLEFNSVRGPVTVNLRTGLATGAGTVAFTGVENMFGSSRGDLLLGDEKANILGGGAGPDIIRGGPGADLIDGGQLGRPEIPDGSDRLYGGPGNDVLLGRKGNDLLDGGRGWDRLHAGRGDDLLRSRDGGRDRVRGDRGLDRARIDHGLDSVRGVEQLL